MAPRLAEGGSFVTPPKNTNNNAGVEVTGATRTSRAKATAKKAARGAAAVATKGGKAAITAGLLTGSYLARKVGLMAAEPPEAQILNRIRTNKLKLLQEPGQYYRVYTEFKKKFGINQVNSGLTAALSNSNQNVVNIANQMRRALRNEQQAVRRQAQQGGTGEGSGNSQQLYSY